MHKRVMAAKRQRICQHTIHMAISGPDSLLRSPIHDKKDGFSIGTRDQDGMAHGNLQIQLRKNSVRRGRSRSPEGPLTRVQPERSTDD